MYGSARLFSLLSILSIGLCLFVPPSFAKEDCGKAAKLSSEAAELSATNPAKAAAKLNDAISYCEKSASLHYNLAMVLIRQAKPDEAAATLEKAVMLKPDYAKALNALAYLAITSADGDKVRARAYAEKAVSLDPRSEEFRATLEMLAGTVEDAPRTAMRRPDAIAIVIGNKSYKNPVLPAVKFALEDASTVKKYLVETLGFSEGNIIMLKDANYIDFKKYFGDEGDHRGILYNRVRKDRSDIFIFYSGHGAPDTNTKKAFLVPADADPSIIKLTGYPMDTLYENLAKLSQDKNPKSMTVVLDSCFSGGSNDGMLIPNASPIFIEATSPVVSMKNAVVFTSAKGNQISSWYPEKNHSLFTYFFLKTLKEAAEGKRTLTAADMEKTLLDAEGVSDHAWRMYNRDQEPQVFGDRKIVLVQ